MHRLTLGTWSETSIYGSTIAPLGKGYLLAPFASWVGLLNNPIPFVYYWTLRPTDGSSAMLSAELGWVGLVQVDGYSMEITDTLVASRYPRVAGI